jgi:hypothetical protein
MKIFLNDIKNIDWLSKALMNAGLKDLLLLKKGCYFVFDYNLNESDSTINITNTKSVFDINERVYQNMTAEHVGYMKEPFDSSNYLFFSILKSACKDSPEDMSKLIDLYMGYKAKDLEQNKTNLKLRIQSNQEITSSISFSNALNNVFYLNEAPVNGLCMVYDLIDGYTKRTNGKTIYGEMLTNIVKSVKNPNGGLLPEDAGSTMRYMIIGQKAGKDDPELKKAKDLLRSGNTPYSIYLETGWFLNKFDNKWRKKISDDSFQYKYENLVRDGEKVYFVPEKYKAAQFAQFVENLAVRQTTVGKEVINGYNGRIKDYISFDEVFSYYPELKEVFSVFSVNQLLSGEYAFYFSPETPFSLVLIAGKQANYNEEKIKYTALHEIQHYIQTIEGFGSGGNTELANLVSSVGGSAVKTFFNSLSAFQKKFSEIASLIPIQDFHNLVKQLEKNFEVKNNYKIRVKIRQNDIPRFINVSDYYKSMLLQFQRLTKDSISVSQNAYSIGYFILTMYAMIEETNEFIEKFVVTNIGKEYMDFFKQALVQNKKTVERDLEFSKKGWSEKDLYILNFQIYESLVGEVESRFTQQTTKIPKELKNYFEFYTSETIDSSKVNVISNSIFTDEGKNVIAGIETNNGKYIIHLPDKYSNSVFLLHETGHILFDFASEEVYANPNSIASAEANNYQNVEEYFCDSFVDYIQRKRIDPALTADLEEDRTITNYTEFDEIFEKMLFSVNTVDESGILKRLNFVMKILE